MPRDIWTKVGLETFLHRANINADAAVWKVDTSLFPSASPVQYCLHNAAHNPTTLSLSSTGRTFLNSTLVSQSDVEHEMPAYPGSICAHQYLGKGVEDEVVGMRDNSACEGCRALGGAANQVNVGSAWVEIRRGELSAY
ncbi:hypothetical protein JR316_0013416 [Psilocybe cubensis]|uniref:Uncharacterized protein n=1 Tax=Psilocybe cubensis TaxID=181762 RepID=A0ACB8GFD4_PSICU|nr:uncharacterized protein JR316_0013416 [Psilocybe cubensis]KAH9474253.1 hypothetical protein JR316_0013416 [Psilocybe cubensis]